MSSQSAGSNSHICKSYCDGRYCREERSTGTEGAESGSGECSAGGIAAAVEEPHGRECRVVPDPQPGFPFYDCQGRDCLCRDSGADQEASVESFEGEEEPAVSRFSQKFHILFVDFVRTLTYTR